MSTSKNTWLAIVIILLFGVLFFGISNSNNSTNSTDSNTTISQESSQNIYFSENGTVVNYEGVSGQTALDTLKRLTAVRTQQSDFGEFVTGIGDIDANPAVNFWGFYVNGEMAVVGAGEYAAMDGDEIKWQLTELN